MNSVKVNTKVTSDVEVDVQIDDIIDAINGLEMKYRWNIISRLLNGVQNDYSDLDSRQKELIKEYLENKLRLF